MSLCSSVLNAICVANEFARGFFNYSQYYFKVELLFTNYCRILRFTSQVLSPNGRVCKGHALEGSIFVRTIIALSPTSAPDVADLLSCAGSG